MTTQAHLLVVDDDANIRTMLRRYLSGEGFVVSEAADGEAARAQLRKTPVDLVLLDVTMPGEDGFSLARAIRAGSQIPIIMLTGKGDLIDRVVGLESGADDYIAKPFHLREVLARIRTVLRRTAAQPVVKPESQANVDVVSFDGWRLDLEKRELSRADRGAVALTTAEFELLAVLVKHANRVLSRSQVMDLVKGRAWAAYDRVIDTQIGRLRKKSEHDPASPQLIKTVRGAGYIFVGKVTRER